MTRLRNSVMANYAGQGWIALMGILFIPVYIGHLGAEAFGLVGFMIGLQSLSALFDMGASVFLSREIARRAPDPVRAQSVPTLVRTFEWLVWPIAALLVLGIALPSDAIAIHWLNPEHLGFGETSRAVVIIGVAVGLLWPSSFYAAALTGMEQQPRLNAMAAVFATLRYAGVIPAMSLLELGVHGFLIWFAVIAALQTVTYALVAWRSLPRSTLAYGWRFSELRDAHRFAFGIFAITLLSTVVTQADRFTLAAIRPLQELGYYTVALTVAAGLGRLMQPMFNAIYPRMSRLVVNGDTATLSTLYHLSTQFLASIGATVFFVTLAYGQEILALWTGDPALSAQVAMPLIILIGGGLLNGLLIAPYALQLAHGNTRISITGNAVALVLGIPFCIATTKALGMTGAALLWLVVNAGFVLVSVPWMHRRLLQGECRRWYLGDVLAPLLASAAVVTVGKTTYPSLGSAVPALAWLTALTLVALAAAGAASSEIRRLAVPLLGRTDGR